MPIEEDNRGFNHVASPVPRPERPVSRIIADEFPGKTYSKSVYDMPLKSEVLGVNLPQSTTRTVETSIDPRFPPKTLVKGTVGAVNYNTASVDASVNTPGVSFLQKKHKRLDHKQTSTPNALKTEGLHHALNAQHATERILDQITNNQADQPEMVLHAKTTNKREDSAFHSHHEHARTGRNTLAGVRAAHTYNRLG